MGLVVCQAGMGEGVVNRGRLVEEADISSLVFPVSHAVLVSSPLSLQLDLPFSYRLPLAIMPPSMLFSNFSLFVLAWFSRKHAWRQGPRCKSFIPEAIPGST